MNPYSAALSCMTEHRQRKEKRVLFISYYFPPLGMGGVQRAAKFAKYLPGFGWKPFVLTVKDIQYLAKDPSLLEELPPEVKIIRVGSFDPLRILFLLRSFFSKKKQKADSVEGARVKGSKLSSWLFCPDSKIGWMPFALLAGLKIARAEKIDLIFTTSPPPSLHLLGYLLKLFTGKPWVADFRDPWVGFHYQDYPTPFHLWLKNILIRKILINADGIVSVNQKIGQRFLSRCPQVRKIRTIPNGYDESDFCLPPSAKSDVFVVAYLGTFSQDHDPRPFLSGLRSVLDEGTVPKDKIKFVHIGLCMGIDFDRLVEKYGLSGVVEKRGYLTHKQALAHLQEASLLLLTTSQTKDAEMISTSKLFEYMASRKPILAIVPLVGAAAEVVYSLNLGKVVSPTDPLRIKRELTAFFSNWEKGRLRFDGEEGKIKMFSRKFLTSQLASLFDEIS
jgi:glycosyltransferase involved in cell wall biosynthesis